MKFIKNCALPCKAVVILAITFTFAFLQGCVSDKIINASNTCSANQTAVRVAELNALGAKMDNKDMVIHMLANKLAGDPCADILIAEINGKNKLMNAATLGAVAVLPQWFNYKSDKELYKALSGANRNSSIDIGINASTGASSEGGGTGDVVTNISTGGDINTGTLTNQEFDKGILGGEGDINDADQVTSDGLL